MGPFLATKDELPDAQNVQIRLSVNGELKQDYTTALMEHPVSEVVARASQISSLTVGDVIATGTYHIGMGPLEDQDQVRLSVEGIGEISFLVRDPAGRTWR
jgi:2-keto-4-pentenoate hydratase/2-oxohepta-3-ene-1,7-dioic acid hydratase in catechol pathway